MPGRLGGTVRLENTVGRRKRWIEDWNPDDVEFWEQHGRRVARRNLVFSILAEHVGFSVWLLWSAVVVYLPRAGVDFTDDQRFWLLAVASLVGATVRLPYTFAVAVVGGRNWTVVSALLLLVPLGLMWYCVATPGTSFAMFVVAAAAAGLGGGNFASSMANISFFYPEREKGFALGLSAAGGNVGVSTVQLVVPAVVGIALVGPGVNGVHLENPVLVWSGLALIAAVCAWLFMDNLGGAARSNVRDQLVVAGKPQTWVMSLLYIGTFGSFIGYSGALPLLIQTQFPLVSGAYFAFLGPLVGSVCRPLGGLLADRVGGARVTLWTFAGLGVGVCAVLYALEVGHFGLFLAAFLALFVLAGIGNGSTYRMIPAIFREQAQAAVADQDGALVVGRRHSAAAIGLVSAVGAYGGFMVQRAFGMSTGATGGIGAALVGFVAFYLACMALTWWCYLRRRLLVAQVASLAHASV
jgi:NNP family nitrate/nitrite transporter-like MFS transporter